MLKIGLKAVEAAGKIIKSNFRKILDSAILEKDKNDFLTYVDEQSEQKIIETIHSELPDHSFLAEESGEHNLGGEYCWIIDPLDGTKNYICGIPIFAVSLALKRRNHVVLGIVYDIMQDEIFYAEKEKGAFLNNQRLSVSNINQLDRSLLATGFPFRYKDKLSQYTSCFHDIFLECSGMRRMGAAAIDLAFVAAGRFEAFWEFGLKSWDMAAGALLISEAGGTVTDFWGNGDYLTNSYILASNGLVHEKLLTLLIKHFPLNKSNKP